MTPERWQQIKRLFQSAIERAPQQRAAFLDEACGGDEQLRREVETLLSAEGQLGDFITKPVVDEAAEVIAAAHDFALSPESSRASSMTGRRIGPYQIQRELGRGGMGAVYLAERADQEYRQQVAIKLIRRGLDSDFVTSRFRHERQILASFNHPNIARLLDGGTTEDRLLYLIMEYIKGEPLDLYCDRRKLSTGERIKLFRQVCAAVHYAHQNLVVHRDLKPDNILVTSAGVPKLLDFGIAKLLEPQIYQTSAASTIAGLRLMTPAYASPEQIRGDPITTASDIYSLGVILYELLTGHRPYRVKTHSPGELERAICEFEPERPSTAVRRVEESSARQREEGAAITPEIVSQRRSSQPDRLRRALAGDLDNITLMALRKEPARRYASAEQLSEDLRRYLEGRPVEAQQDTFTYRARKFIKRNKAGVAAAALVAFSLVGGIVATAWQARVARAERARAERRFNDVRELANRFLFEFHDEIVNLPGSTAARELVVKRALEYLDRLREDASSDAALARELAVGYLRLGDAQGNPAYANRGELSAAIESYKKSLGLLESADRLEPGNARTQRFIGIAHERIGEVALQMGEVSHARERYQKTLEIREAAIAADPGSEVALRDVSISYERLGDLSVRALETQSALDFYRKGFEAGAKILAARPADPLARRDMAIGHDRMGDILLATGEVSRALAEYRQGEAIRNKLISEDQTSTEYQRDLSISGNKIGDALLKTGDAAGAGASHRRALELVEEMVKADPQNAQARRDVAIGRSRVGGALLEGGRRAEALASLRQAEAAFVELVGNGSENSQVRSDLALVRDLIGEALAAGGERAGAIEAHGGAGAIFAELAKEDPEGVLAKRDLAMHENRFAESLLRLGDAAGAARRFEAALAILEPMVERDAINVESRFWLAKALSGMGACRAAAGDYAGAVAEMGRAEKHLETVVAKDAAYVEALRRLGAVTAEIGRAQVKIAEAAGDEAERRRNWSEAERDFRRSLDVWVALRDRGRLRSTEAREPARVQAELVRCAAMLR